MKTTFINKSNPMTTSDINYQELLIKIQNWSQQLGFSQIGISDVDLSTHEEHLLYWLKNNYHGTMDYMQRHGLMRARPSELLPDTIRVISVRLDYLPKQAKFSQTLKDKQLAYISRYALGRDYHKLLRQRLQKLGKKISSYCTDFNFRPFVDSAPILERPLAAKAGLGWVGKHSLLLNKEAGSWFFIGELLVDIPLPVTIVNTHSQQTDNNDCGNCIACIKICPTQAIVKPYVVDSRRCISYFTIESAEAIPVELRAAMGNRIYGCDDCQLVCPWNQYAKLGLEADLQPRRNLDQISLLELFNWNESDFMTRLKGSAIRRIGFQSWQRNIAVALGNADYDANIVAALNNQLATSSQLVAEHIRWALAEQAVKKETASKSVNLLTTKLIRAIEKNLPRDA